VHCSERGRALALAWNASVDAAAAAVGGVRASNTALRARAAALAARNEELAREFKAVDFLRREALRFRRAAEEAQAQAAAAAAEGEALRAQLAAAEAEVAAVDSYARSRCGPWVLCVLGTLASSLTVACAHAKGMHGRLTQGCTPDSCPHCSAPGWRACGGATRWRRWAHGRGR
jgi:hypothetical protein